MLLQKKEHELLLERVKISSIALSAVIAEAIVLFTLFLNIYGGHGKWHSRLVEVNVN